MLAGELEQDADDLVLHQAEPLGAAPAVAVLQQHVARRLARLRQRGLEPLGDRAAQLPLAAGVLVGERSSSAASARGVEQLGFAAGLSSVSIGDIGIAKRGDPVTAAAPTMVAEKRHHSKGDRSRERAFHCGGPGVDIIFSLTVQWLKAL